jgi:plastocyanin
MPFDLPRLLGSAAVCTLVLAGATWAVDRSVSTSAPPAAPSAPPPPGSATLTIASFVYDPNPLSVAPGTTVAVTNEDAAKHTVTSGARDAADGKFDLRLDGSGSGTLVAPSEPGSYPYICTIHPGMKSTIEVTP